MRWAGLSGVTTKAVAPRARCSSKIRSASRTAASASGSPSSIFFSSHSTTVSPRDESTRSFAIAEPPSSGYRVVVGVSGAGLVPTAPRPGGLAARLLKSVYASPTQCQEKRGGPRGPRHPPAPAATPRLLTSFMEMRPPSHTFAALLARYVADSRPGIAGAATALQRAWARASQGTIPALLPFEDLLRTLGSLLDEAGARAGSLSVGPDGAPLQGCGPTPCQRTLGPLELHQENAGRSALRSQVLPTDEAAQERFEGRLRVVGAMLETQPMQVYEIVIG